MQGRQATRHGVLAWFLLLGTGVADAAQLSMGAPRIGANGWEMPLMLSPGAGESVSSMQFDLVLPPGLGGASAQVSDAAALAGKQAMFSEIAPGQVRVVIAGLNQSPMAGGQVATVYLGPAVEGQAAPGALLSAPVLASPSGERVPVEANTESAEGEEGEDADMPVAEEESPETPPKNVGDVPEPVEDSGDDAPVEEEDGDSAGRSNGYYGGYPPYGNGGGGAGITKGKKAAKKNSKEARPSPRGAAATKAATGKPVPQRRDYASATAQARNAARNPASPEAVKSRAVDQRRNKFAQPERALETVGAQATGAGLEERTQLAEAGLNREDWGGVGAAPVAANGDAAARDKALGFGVVTPLPASQSLGGAAVVACAIAALALALAAVYLPVPWLHRLLRLNRPTLPSDE